MKQQDARLPPLRADLRCFAGAPDHDGLPALIVEDPVTNRFFRIGWLDAAMLARWSLADPRRLAAAVASDTGQAPDEDEIRALAGFLRDHDLLEASATADTDRLADRAAASRTSPASWLLHHYLFFRIPLLRPARILRTVLPWVGWLWHPLFRMLALVCTVLGLLLAARQWDVIRHTAIDWLTPGGLVAVLVALAIAKTVHELGHALTATRYGVRVGHMGIAFMVLWPMLYTDTGEAWRLVDRRRRFAIAAAGIKAELVLAGFATLAWSLVEDGPLRQGLFVLATTSWVMTLAINVSPFMRFDGYFLLCDALDLPNLHGRSFALARAALRRGLLGWDEPDPEPFPPRRRRALVVFAWLTWLYRLVLFIGIAVAVYHLFFKALGILLLIVELAWFIARPIAHELAHWRRGWRRTQGGFAARTLLGLLALGALAVLPWSREIEAQGWLHAARSQPVHAAAPGRIERLAAAGPVAAGTELVALAAPEIARRARVADLAVATLAQRVDQAVGRTDGVIERVRLLEELAARRADAMAEAAELARLVVVAGFDGQVTDVDPGLRPGAWVAPDQVLMVLVDPGAWIVDALVSQEAIARVAPGAAARFRPWRGQGQVLTGTVIAIDRSRITRLPHPLFDANHGGTLATRDGTAMRDRAGTSPGDTAARLPQASTFRVRIRVDGAPATLREASGQVFIAGEATSLLADGWRWLAGLWVRESGF